MNPLTGSPASVCSPILSSDCMKAEDNPASEVSAVRVVPFLDPSDEAVAASALSDQIPEAYLPTSYSLQPPSSSTASKALHVVLSWNFPFPHQPKNCRVEVCVKPRNDVLFAEALHLRVMYQALLITESIVSIDQAFELTNLIKYMPQAVDDSAAHHQAILRNMFFEVILSFSYILVFLGIIFYF